MNKKLSLFLQNKTALVCDQIPPQNNNAMNTSYREMLRDRCPIIVDFALKWCKAKQRWIDHVYENSIQFYKSKKDKNEACRIMLGISKKHRGFDFHYTITWDNLIAEEKEYWESIEKWVNWFQIQFQAIEQDISVLNYTKTDIKNKYLSFCSDQYGNKLVDYLFSCYEILKH